MVLIGETVVAEAQTFLSSSEKALSSNMKEVRSSDRGILRDRESETTRRRTFWIDSEQLQSGDESDELGLTFLSGDMDRRRGSFPAKAIERKKGQWSRNKNGRRRRRDETRTHFLTSFSPSTLIE